MKLPEYGRSIQNMVDYAVTIEDKAERQRCANTIISIMGNMNPQLRDVTDFNHKLWDHFFIMSDFKLDVDSPYTKPSRQDLTVTPKRLPYPQSRVMFKHYGKYAERFVRTINSHGATEKSRQGMMDIGRYMRSKSYEFNNEHPKNDSIIRDMRLMAGGNIEVDLAELLTMRSEYYKQPQRNHKHKGTQHKNNNGRKPQRNMKTQQRTK
jgi:hypothetical protein